MPSDALLALAAALPTTTVMIALFLAGRRRPAPVMLRRALRTGSVAALGGHADPIAIRLRAPAGQGRSSRRNPAQCPASLTLAKA